MSITKNFDPETVKDNPFQPRQHYSTTKIAELANSIEKVGLISIPVGRQLQDGTVELAVGHERKRAFIKLKKKKPTKFPVMPVEIKDLSDEAMSIMALEENLRREGITPLEMAYGVDNHLKNFPNITEKVMAELMGMTQPNISNMRRVLKCPDKILQKIVDGKINFTMARELLVFKDLNIKTKRRWGGQFQERTEEFLMNEAVKEVGKPYGPAATVDGIKKAIYNVCHEYLPILDKETTWGDSQPLFDTGPCSKCNKMIKANETKSHKRRFCTDPACWNKKQEAHKKKMAAEAKKAMEAELAHRMKEAEKELIPDKEEPALIEEAEEILEEKSQVTEDFVDDRDIDDFEDDIDELIESDEIEESPEAKEAPTFETPEEVCKMCINKKTCGGQYRTGRLRGGGFYCLERVTKDNYQEIREKAKANIPDSMKEMVKDNAGTRAEVVDVRDLRLGNYSGNLKAGFALLSERVYDGFSRGDGAHTIFDRIDDPDECLKRCTEGFHYGFDSERDSAEVLFVCSNPKCLTKKKAAFTRAKNARGNAKKKAEAAAIKEAVEKTTALGRGHMKIILGVILIKTTTNYYSNEQQNTATAVAKHLNVEPVKHEWGDSIDTQKTVTAILNAADKLPEEELAKCITLMCLEALKYTGEIANYKIHTTEPLEWLGVKIPNLPEDETKKGKKEKATA
jgi:ParB/RepB/Spo0J family partition protein